MDYLREILLNKRREVERLKDSLEPARLEPPHTRTTHFKKIFKKGELTLIAEIKKCSPSRGKLIRRLDITKTAQIYEHAGADAISVVTDKKFFGGDCSYIKKIKKVVNLPVLRKDFIIAESQIYETYEYGADALLLIAGILSISQLKRFVRIAHRLNIETIVEVHDAEELNQALGTDTTIIGVNNRNLKNFKVDIDVSLRLRQLIPEGYLTISESGIEKFEDVERLRNAGYDGILVGSAILTAQDMVEKIRSLKWKGYQS